MEKNEVKKGLTRTQEAVQVVIKMSRRVGKKKSQTRGKIWVGSGRGREILNPTCFPGRLLSRRYRTRRDIMGNQDIETTFILLSHEDKQTPVASPRPVTVTPVYQSHRRSAINMSVKKKKKNSWTWCVIFDYKVKGNSQYVFREKRRTHLPILSDPAPASLVYDEDEIYSCSGAESPLQGTIYS